jgi:tellurite resistance protein TehA-like permease
MLPYRQHARTPVSRFGEMLAGFGIGMFAALLGAVAIFMGFKIVSKENIELEPTVFISFVALLGLFCGVTAFRLITGKGRKSDGGLFPPWLLRILGLLFLAGSVFLAYVSIQDNEFRLIGGILTFLTIGFGCFYLASRQERATEELLAKVNDT